MEHSLRLLRLLVTMITTAAVVTRTTTLAHVMSPVVGLRTEKILYRAEGDDVVLINTTNFKPMIFGKDNAWLVQFYNSWCGHCILFAPTYIELAHKVKAWHSIIRIAAINCAEEANLGTCREYEAFKFPTFKFFSVNAMEGSLGELGEFSKTVPDIQAAMVDYLMSSSTTSLPSWPHLLPIEYSDMNAVWSDSHVLPTHNHVALLVHGDNYLPKYVILDLSHLTSHIAVFNIHSEQDELAKSLNNKDVTANSLVIVDRSGKTQIFTDCGDDRDCYVKHVQDFVLQNIDPNAVVTQSPVNAEETVTVTVDDVDRDHAYLLDVETVVYYVLFQEVALRKLIDGDKLKALQNFLGVLSKYLPVNGDITEFLRRLWSWLSSQSSVNAQDFETKRSELQESLSLKLSMNEWMGCRGSQRHLRGYPCGLWTTFHILTVNAFIQHGKDADYDPLEVTAAIRGYVVNFFSCKHCAEHFSAMSSNLSNEISSAEDSVLWLWNAHNRVNLRLRGEGSEDPTHIKKQFPMPELCSACATYNPSDQVLEKDGRVSQRPQWNVNEVLDYLIRHYSHEGIIGGKPASGPADASPNPSITIQEVWHTNDPDDLDSSSGGIVRGRDLMKYGSQKIDDQPVETQSVFSRWSVGRADISICVVLYLSSILLLLLCYVFVLSRRKWSLLAAIQRKRVNLV